MGAQIHLGVTHFRKVATSRIGIHSWVCRTHGDASNNIGFNGSQVVNYSMDLPKESGTRTHWPKIGMLVRADGNIADPSKIEEQPGDEKAAFPLPMIDLKDAQTDQVSRRSIHMNEEIYETTWENSDWLLSPLGETEGIGFCHRFLTEDKAACPVDKDWYYAPSELEGSEIDETHTGGTLSLSLEDAQHVTHYIALGSEYVCTAWFVHVTEHDRTDVWQSKSLSEPWDTEGPPSGGQPNGSLGHEEVVVQGTTVGTNVLWKPQGKDLATSDCLQVHTGASTDDSAIKESYEFHCTTILWVEHWSSPRQDNVDQWSIGTGHEAGSTLQECHDWSPPKEKSTSQETERSKNIHAGFIQDAEDSSQVHQSLLTLLGALSVESARWLESLHEDSVLTDLECLWPLEDSQDEAVEQANTLTKHEGHTEWQERQAEQPKKSENKKSLDDTDHDQAGGPWSEVRQKPKDHCFVLTGQVLWTLGALLVDALAPPTHSEGAHKYEGQTVGNGRNIGDRFERLLGGVTLRSSYLFTSSELENELDDGDGAR